MIEIGTLITEEYIERSLVDLVTQLGYEDWNPTSKHCAEHYSADGDPDGDFYESLSYTNEWHSQIFERDIEYREVHSKVEACIQDRLREEGFYQEGKVTEITHKNIEQIEQCIYDAANDVTWLISEALQVFLETTNPCCWNNRTPQERYGDNWIKDPETRVRVLEWEGRGQHTNLTETIREKGWRITKGIYDTIYATDRDGEEIDEDTVYSLLD